MDRFRTYYGHLWTLMDTYGHLWTDIRHNLYRRAVYTDTVRKLDLILAVCLAARPAGTEG